VPRYSYRCTKCEELLVIFHLSDETASECPECGCSMSLVKLLNNFTTGKKKKAIKQKVGQVSEEFIKDARHELAQQKQELDKNR